MCQNVPCQHHVYFRRRFVTYEGGKWDLRNLYFRCAQTKVDSVLRYLSSPKTLQNWNWTMNQTQKFSILETKLIKIVMTLVMFPAPPPKKKLKHASGAIFIKRAKIMLLWPNYAKTYARTIYEGWKHSFSSLLLLFFLFNVLLVCSLVILNSCVGCCYLICSQLYQITWAYPSWF